MSLVSAADGSGDTVPVDPVRLAEQGARDLLKDEDVPAAREVTEDALRTSPDRPELLWLLADVEFADGDQHAGLCCLAKAADAGGRDAAAISRQIRALSENRLWREALLTVEHVPAGVHSDPRVRTAVGDFYRTIRCHGHAASAYGDGSGLLPSARKKRRRSWLRSGGPFTFARGRVEEWEDSQLLSDLRRNRRTCAQLDAVPDLDSRQAHRLKVRLEYLGLAVEQLRSQGRLVDDTVLAHLSPAQSESIGLIGTITVDIDHELAQLDPTGHRPLREPTAAARAP